MSTGKQACGFTLVEMLVVLMVMGVLVGLIAVKIGPQDRDLLRNEAERLAQVLDLAAEEARLSGKSVAWVADDTSYRFLRLGSDNEWSEIRDNDVLRARKMVPGVTISDLRVEVMRARDSKRVEFPAGGAMLSFSVQLTLGVEHYSIEVSPVGEFRVSPGKGVPYAKLAPQ